MFESARMLYLYVESPLHAGSGRGLGAVDLPIQRERVTSYPLVQASGLKGAMRSECEKRSKDKTSIKFVFGPETANAPDHAGAFSPGDARLLLFPVRSLAGVFAWTTSMDALSRFFRDAAAICQPLKMEDDKLVALPNAPESGVALVSPANVVTAGGKVVLDEFSFTPTSDQAVQNIANWLAKNALPGGEEYKYWRDKLPKSLVVLHEDAFRDFTQFATEVVTRVKLNSDTKTVDKETGALWTEENLPVDTLLYAPLAAVEPRFKGQDSRPEQLRSASAVMEWVAQWLNGKRIQMGGDETVGRGSVALRFGPIHSLNGKGGSHG